MGAKNRSFYGARKLNCANFFFYYKYENTDFSFLVGESHTYLHCSHSCAVFWDIVIMNEARTRYSEKIKLQLDAGKHIFVWPKGGLYGLNKGRKI